MRIADLVAAYRAGDLGGMLSYFAPDVIFMAADRPASRGLPDLKRYLERAFEHGVELISLSSDRFVSAEEVAVQSGRYHRRVPRGDGEAVDETGSYELTWRMQDDGEYRVTSWTFTREPLPNGRPRF
jgi:ketosteroid isomerase-like protein